MKSMQFAVKDTRELLDLPQLSQVERDAPLNGCDIQLRDVSFSYGGDGEEVLHHLDLTIPQGKFTALVGPSGGGKSTIARLAARFWDVTGGSITLGGRDIREPVSYTHLYFIPMLSRSPHVPSLTAVEGSDKFLALIEEFQTTDDPARVQEIFDQLLNFDNDNVLDLPLLFVKDMIVYNTDKVAGYDFSSTPMFFDVRLIQPAE